MIRPTTTRRKGEATLPAPAKLREKGDIVPPVRTLQLVQSVGVTQASRVLGVSTTTLHKARKQGLVSKVIEVAADGILYKKEGGHVPDVRGAITPVQELVEHTGKVLYLLQVDAHKAPIVERLGRMLEADIMRG